MSSSQSSQDINNNHIGQIRSRVIYSDSDSDSDSASSTPTRVVQTMIGKPMIAIIIAN